MSESENKKPGVIYILTNPSFPMYVKIGYADNIEQRLKQLNRSECVPFAFRVYATYEVTSRLSDTKVHAIIDNLNPNLRSIDTFEGHKRVREFYAISPEDIFSILEAIAEINGRRDKLKLISPNKNEIIDEEIAEDIEEEKKERLAPFSFSYCKIPVGSILEYSNQNNENCGISCKVIDDRTVEYQEKKWSLSALAKFLTQSKYNVADPRYFKYKGAWLNDIRKRVIEQETKK